MFLALEELPQMPAIPGIAVLGDGEAPPRVVPSAAAVDGTSFGALARALAQAVPPPTSPDFALEDGVSVSGKMVAKIQAGQYVELAELLPDNLELLKREVGPFFEWMPQSRSQLRSIPSVLSWARCFSTYAIVRCAGDPSRAASLFSYMRLILQEAAKLGGEGWRTYDTRFRKLAAVRPEMDWATPHQGIYAQTFVALGNNAPRCPVCLDTDHVKAVCSLRDASTDRNVARAASPAGARTNHGRFAADTTREHVNFRIALTGTCAMFVGELIGPSTAIRPVASATTREKASAAGSRVVFVEAAIGSARPCRAAGVRSNCVGCVTFFVCGRLLV